MNWTAGRPPLSLFCHLFPSSASSISTRIATQLCCQSHAFIWIWKSFVFCFFSLYLVYRILCAVLKHASTGANTSVDTIIGRFYLLRAPDRPTDWYPQTAPPPIQFLSYDFTPCVRIHWSSLIVLYSGRRLFSFANFFSSLWFGSRRPSIPSSPAEIQVLTTAIIFLLLFLIRHLILANPSKHVGDDHVRRFRLVRPPGDGERNVDPFRATVSADFRQLQSDGDLHFSQSYRRLSAAT